MEIPKLLKDAIWEYCRVNDITNIDEFMRKLITNGFTIEKYGATPVEKIVEKVVEVPVEKIVEKIVEVPVEKIVVQEVMITDDTELKKMLDSNKRLTIANQLLNNSVTELKLQIETLTSELTIEKNKNKKDIYGES